MEIVINELIYLCCNLSPWQMAIQKYCLGGWVAILFSDGSLENVTAQYPHFETWYYDLHFGAHITPFESVHLGRADVQQIFLSDERSTSPGWSCQLGLWMCSGEFCDAFVRQELFLPKIGVSQGKQLYISMNYNFWWKQQRANLEEVNFFRKGGTCSRENNTLWLPMFYTTKLSL